MPHLSVTSRRVVAVVVTCAASLVGAGSFATTSSTAATPPFVTTAPLAPLQPLAVFNTSRYPLNPTAVVDLRGVGYFTALPDDHTALLMRTDGSGPGTTVVRNLGTMGASELSVVGGALYFVAAAPTGSETVLWTSDGTADGTVPVTSPVFNGLSRARIVAANENSLYVFAFFATNEAHLVRVDTNTHEITSLPTPRALNVDAFSPPAGLPDAAASFAPDGSLYLDANTSNSGDVRSALFRVSGTTVSELATSQASAVGPALIVPDGTAYFTRVPTGTLNPELWQSDGTTGGTHVVAGVNATPSDPLSPQLIAGDTAYFGVFRIRNGTITKYPSPVAGQPLPNLARWSASALGNAIYFGTTGPLERLDNDATDPVSIAGPPLVDAFGVETTVGNNVYFTAGDHELWRTDGTTDGTAKLGTIPFAVGIDGYRSNRRVVTAFGHAGGITYFNASGDLWRVEGATAHPVELATRRTVRGVTVVAPPINGKAVILAGDSIRESTADRGDNSSWVNPRVVTADGTPTSIRTAGTFPSDRPGRVVQFKGRDFFSLANSGQLWATDGQTTQQIPYATSAGSFISDQSLVSGGGRLFFGVLGTTSSLMTYDGSTMQTIHRFADGLRINAAVATRTGIVFSRGDSDTGGMTELWTSDGTTRGTHRLAGIPTRYDNPVLIPAGRLTYFLAERGAQNQLWRTDGTRTGTVRLARVDTRGGAGIGPSALAVGPHGILFFGGIDRAGKRRGLWRTNGNVKGTKLVQRLAEREVVSEMVRVGESIALLTTRGPDLGDKPTPRIARLWRATAHGASPIRSMRFVFDPSVRGYGAPAQLTSVDGTLAFAGPSGLSTTTVWTSDGSPLGTHIRTDASAAGLQTPTAFTAVGQRLGVIADGETGDGILYSLPLPHSVPAPGAGW